MILEASEANDKLFIVQEGHVNILREGQVRPIYALDYFGENSVWFSGRSSVAYVAGSEVKC